MIALRPLSRPAHAPILAAAWVAWVLAGCTPSTEGSGSVESDGGPAVLRTLERLAFVPAGRTPRNSAISVGSERDLVVDRFEVTWDVWDRTAPVPSVVPALFRPEARTTSPSAVPGAWLGDVPVVGVTLAEAEGCAAARGMRLPTFAEWMWCALGSLARDTPSGRSQVNIANTSEVGLGHLVPVGAFEAGRTPDTGIHDLVGNAWEWVRVEPDGPARDWPVLDVESWSPDRWRDAGARWMGGSFLFRAQRLYSPRLPLSFSMAAVPEHRASDVGFRCVAEAVPYLVWLAAEAEGPLDGDGRTRAQGVGRRWGPRAAPALRAALAERPESTLLAQLLAGAEGP